MFAVQSTVSTAGQYLLRPDCELSVLPPAIAFYNKMVMFSTLPPAIVCGCLFFWKMQSTCRACFCLRGEAVAWRHRTANSFSAKDKAVLSIVVLLYMVYPTTLRQVFSMVACRRVGHASFLAADLQEPCFEGRHLAWFFGLCLPQFPYVWHALNISPF